MASPDRQEEGTGKRSPLRNPGKFSKNGEQPTTQPLVSLDIKRKS